MSSGLLLDNKQLEKKVDKFIADKTAKFPELELPVQTIIKKWRL